MTASARFRPFFLLAVGAFFAFAPAWAPHIQQVWGRNLFATPDSMVLLGVTLLVSLLACYILPDFLVSYHSTPGVGSRGREIKPRGLVWVKVFAAVSCLISLVYGLYLVNQHILHSFLSSADEHSCYFLAECLRKGKLYVDIPPLADFFKVVHVGMRDGKWFSVYPPGWPLIWALGLQFNIVDWLNPALSALSVFFFYLSAIRLFSRGSVVCGLLICVLNPFFMFTAASYFSHATCLLCISVFLYAFLRWREAYGLSDCHPRPDSVIPAKAGIQSGISSNEDSKHGFPIKAFGNDTRKRSEKSAIFWASVCAFAVGYGLMTRYLTMAAVAVPFLLYHYLPIFFESKGTGSFSDPEKRCLSPLWLRWLPFTFKRPRLRKSDWIAIGIIAVFMLLILYQNYLVTGKAFRAPNKHDKSWERLGFRSNYTPVDGLFALIARVFYLMDWFAPAVVVAYLFLVGRGLAPFSVERGQAPFPAENEPVPVKKVPDPLGRLFRLGMVFIAVAYFFYFSWGGNQWGPRYLWEGMPFLCIAVADWLARLWRDGDARVKKFVLTFIIMSLVTSGMIFARQAEYVEESSRQRKALYDLAEQTINKPGIVFIHGFLGNRLIFAEEDAIRNSPFLDGRILYVHDLGDRNKELMAAYPGREYYRGTYDQAAMEARLDSIGR